jgi:replicative DNA helicase
MQTKPLPNSLESEQALIGAMLSTPSLIPDIKNKLELSDIYNDKIQIIYTGILEAPLKEMSCVWNSIDQTQIDKSYFMELASLPTASAWEYHLNNILKLSKQRKLWYIGKTLSEQVIRSDFNIDDVLSSTQSKLHEVNKTDDEISQEDQWMITYNEIFHNAEPGIYTGIADLDPKFYFESGYIHCIAAESGVGKSAFMMQAACNIGNKYQGKALYFSLESTFNRLARRNIARTAKVALTRINKNHFTDDTQIQNIWDAVNKLGQSNLVLETASKFMMIEKLINYLESYLVNHRVSSIWIDFLQALDSIKSFTSDRSKFNYIINYIKGFAKDTNIPIIYACQLRKDIEGEPKLDDLIESNYIRTHTDNIIFLYAPDSSPVEYPVKCYLAKGKEQERFSQWLNFNGNFQMFSRCDEPPLIQKKKSKGWQDK